MAVKELFKIFPALSGFYLQWEKDFRWDNVSLWVLGVREMRSGDLG